MTANVAASAPRPSGPTDVAWDSNDNIDISDGYTNSRVAKVDKKRKLDQELGIARNRGPRADPRDSWALEEK